MSEGRVGDISTAKPLHLGAEWVGLLYKSRILFAPISLEFLLHCDWLFVMTSWIYQQVRTRGLHPMQEVGVAQVRSMPG